MKKLLAIFLISLLAVNAYGANNWRQGIGEDCLLGSEAIADVDVASFQNIVDPLDRMLSNYRKGCRIVYASAATVTVEIGEIMLSNSDGSIRIMQKNTSSTTVTWSDIDTGAETSSANWYVWAYQETVTDSDFDLCFSLSSSAPSGKTYYALLGGFRNGNQGNITRIDNNNFFVKVGAATSKSSETTYQASTAGFIAVRANTSSTAQSTVTLNTREESGDSWGDKGTIQLDDDHRPGQGTIFGVVQAGDYYRIDETGSVTVAGWFYPLED